MEQQPNTKLKVTMTYGIYLAAISIVLSLIIWATSLIEHMGLFGSAFIGVFQLVMLAFLLVYFTKRYRDTMFDGRITFGQAFSFGVMLIVFSSVISSLYSFILNKYIDPDYMHRVMTMIQDKTYQMLSNSGLSQDQIDAQMSKFEEKGIPTPIETLVSSLEGGLIGGAIMSLISSAIVKKNVKGEDAFDEAMEDIKTEETKQE
jgi:prepilin signal peptidase PulO-like enzyme (type II secretory pathway)